ncbi:MAG: ATP-binding protein [Archangiaceae bacterium]|nr:ATP-binding protein [Archangiaceae bacterium]
MNGCDAGTFTVERVGDYAVAKPVRRIAECSSCSGTGLHRATIEDRGRRYEVSRACALSQLQGRLQLFNQAQLPAVHGQSAFETFRTPRYEAVARAKSIAHDFAHRWPQQRGFILSGPVGTGKTHLLAATLRHATIEMGVQAAYVEISLLYATIRRGFQEGKSGGEIIKPLSQVDLLAIDELGKGRGSPFELETLDELIARRYNAGKVTLFATNYALAPPEERARPMVGYESTDDRKESARESKQLCDRVGARIYSRLCEMCEFVEFPPDTTDHRRLRADNDVLRGAKAAPRPR